ncbi:MAG: hypothetical protein RLZZ59_264 [Pseudomonadota bacterium]|jgi:DNA replication and repair protein RecF
MTKIEKLHLTNYRNFDFFSSEFPSGISLILGDNGIGKTNLLEAISQLTPGRGIRGSAPDMICKTGSRSWSIDSSLGTKLSSASIKINYNLDSRKKILEFNGSKITQSELAKFTSAIWLTPQMDGLWSDAPSERRKFLDRLTLVITPSHASLVSKAEKLQRERMQILETNFSDNNWLSTVERELASLYFSITQNRRDTIDLLNKNLNSVDSTFPKALLKLDSKIEENSEKVIADILCQNRSLDRDSARTNFGSNKDDFLSYYMPEKIPSHLCSTGQQKSLLISILMAHQIAIISRDSLSPILLLDEIFVHLDDIKRDALAEFLLKSGAQCFVTSTEAQLEILLKSPAIISL